MSKRRNPVTDIVTGEEPERLTITPSKPAEPEPEPKRPPVMISPRLPAELVARMRGCMHHYGHSLTISGIVKDALEQWLTKHEEQHNNGNQWPPVWEPGKVKQGRPSG